MHHINGTLIFGIILAIIVYHFFGFPGLVWCAIAAVAIMIIAFFYMIFVSEGWIPDFYIVFKKLWRRYLKWEAKFFHWVDEIF